MSVPFDSLPTGPPAKFLIPADDDLGTNWTGLDFDDAGWESGRTGLGYSTNGMPATLYSYWPIQEGNGSVVSNLVVGGSPGSISGAAWAQDVVRGTVLSFDGFSSYVSAGSIPRMGQTGSNFTWSFWYHQKNVLNTNVVVLGNRSGGNEAPLQFIKFTPSHFEYYRGGNIGFMPHEITSGSWRHLAAVKDGAALRYYDNGILVGAATAGGDIESNPFYWGGDPGAAGEYANGLLDDISLWTSALTSSQVSVLASGASPLSLNGLGQEVATDLKVDMFGVNASLYVRVPFHCPAQTGFSTLTLHVKYKIGFVAWLNGVEVARRNAPANAQWNSTASSPHNGVAATQYEDIDVSVDLDLLQVGANVLAFHLGAGLHGLGYAISNLLTYTAWRDNGRINANYGVSYSSDGTNFHPISTVAYNPSAYPINDGTGGTCTSLAVAGLNGVRYLRWNFSANQQNGGVGYTELAAFGQSNAPLVPPNLGVSQPDPASFVLAVSGLLTGQRYLLQSTTNLADAVWFTEADFVATQPVASFTNSTTTYPQKFYRVSGYQ